MLYQFFLCLLTATRAPRVDKYSVHAPQLPCRKRIEVFWLWQLFGVERDRCIVYCEGKLLCAAYNPRRYQKSLKYRHTYNELCGMTWQWHKLENKKNAQRDGSSVCIITTLFICAVNGGTRGLGSLLMLNENGSKRANKFADKARSPATVTRSHDRNMDLIRTQR